MRSKSSIFYIVIMTVIVCMLTMLLYTETADAVLTGEDISIESQSAIVIDANSGTVLYDKDAKKKIYPASTTKVLTAIVAIENSDMDDVLTVSENALTGQENNGTHIGLKLDEQITMKDALYGMMLESANDAAIAIAEGISGSEEEFAKLLNKKVKDLGLTDSNFVTPNGLFDENHYTTAYDMAKITEYAMKNEEFKELFGASKYTLSKTNKRSEALDIYTTHRMTSGKSKYYEYTIGGKTGYLDESKCNLVTAAQKDDTTLIAYVATNSSPYDICDDTQKLFEECFAKYQSTTVKKDKSGNTVNSLIDESSYKIKRSEASSENVAITLPKDIKASEVQFKIVEKDISFPVEKGDVTGYLQATYNDEVVGSSELTATKDMSKFGFIVSIALKVLIFGGIAAVILIIVLRMYFTFKKKNRRKYVR